MAMQDLKEIEENRKRQLVALQTHCQQYKDYLFENIKKSILEVDEMVLLYYDLSKLKNQDEFVDAIIEELKFGMLNLNFNHDFFLFLKKYALINDMLYTLEREATVSQKEIEFSEKFLMHQKFLQKKSKPSFSIWNFFSPETVEDFFLRCAKQFCQKIEDKEMKVSY